MSHWSKKWIFDDYMIATQTTGNTYISNITLAFFEDMGWYKVDYSFASTP